MTLVGDSDKDREKSVEPIGIEVVNVHAIELDPNKRYVILLDQAAVSREDATNFLYALRGEGIEHAVALMVDGDPATVVQIVEQP